MHAAAQDGEMKELGVGDSEYQITRNGVTQKANRYIVPALG